MTAVDRFGLRLFGVEDGSFEAFPREEPTYSFLCGVEVESDFIRKIRLKRIQVDGLDATDKLLTMLGDVEVDAVILGGITFAGFNIVDPRIILEEKGFPVIVYSGKKPENEAMLRALRKNFDDWRERWEIVQNLGPIYTASTHPGEPSVYFEVIGGTGGWAEDVIRRSALVSRIPEPVRVAGLVARGLSPAS